METQISSERLAELRNVLSRIDAAGKRAWILEIYTRIDGADVLTGCVNIKTGRKWQPQSNYQKVARARSALLERA